VESLASHTVASLEALLVQGGWKPSHAARLLRSYHGSGGEPDWETLRVPVGMREALLAQSPLFVSQVVRRQVAEDGTTKLLLQLEDARKVEAVMMTDLREDRVAGCISSQAGCAMGCDFCATAQGGLERNLTAGEMTEQFLRIKAEALRLGRQLRTIVFMGMGEPMHNIENVIGALHRIAPNELGSIGWRQITVSTVGIVSGIERLGEERLRVNLAVSLHAPDDETRRRILPMGRRHGVEEILAAADRYMGISGLPAIVQYCMLKDVNDSPDQARLLARLLQGRRMHVNLIQYNPTGPGLSGFAYESCPVERMEAFLEVLRSERVVAHFRRPRGRDIAAACGQLRAAERKR